MDVGWGDWGNTGSSGHGGTIVIWGWGLEVWVVEISMIWWVWVMSETGFGSGSITGGGVWSSGGGVGVVMWDISWLVLEAWGTGWSILWSVGSGAWWGNAVDSERSVVSVAFWEVLSSSVSLLWGDVVLSGDGSEGKEVGVGGEFHICNY